MKRAAVSAGVANRRQQAKRCVLIALSALFLAACGSTVGPELELEVTRSSQKTWHNRLLSTIKNPNYNSSMADLDPQRQARSGDLYVYGREMNQYMTSLILAYRETGDRKLVQQMDRLMDRTKRQLKDYNRDGFRSWRYLNRSADRSSRPFFGKDTHEMDEMMTHAMVAAVAYTFKQAGFNSSARYWTNYLENDFEAKWRKRNGKRSGFPFMTKTLMHPYAQWIRYHHYMGKLTGNSAYTKEARRMARVVEKNMRTVGTPSGTGYVWDHRVQLKGRASRGCQPMVYVRLTTQAFADLGTQGVFSSSFMRRAANTMAYKALKRTDGSKLAGNICGRGSYGNINTFSSQPYAQLASWDRSGRLKQAAERAFSATERHRTSAPRKPNLPATMVFTLGR